MSENSTSKQKMNVLLGAIVAPVGHISANVVADSVGGSHCGPLKKMMVWVMVMVMEMVMV